MSGIGLSKVAQVLGTQTSKSQRSTSSYNVYKPRRNIMKYHFDIGKMTMNEKLRGSELRTSGSYKLLAPVAASKLIRLVFMQRLAPIPHYTLGTKEANEQVQQSRSKT